MLVPLRASPLCGNKPGLAAGGGETSSPAKTFLDQPRASLALNLGEHSGKMGSTATHAAADHRLMRGPSEPRSFTLLIHGFVSDNKCLLFQATELWGGLLHNNS